MINNQTMTNEDIFHNAEGHLADGNYEGAYAAFCKLEFPLLVDKKMVGRAIYFMEMYDAFKRVQYGDDGSFDAYNQINESYDRSHGGYNLKSKDLQTGDKDVGTAIMDLYLVKDILLCSIIGEDHASQKRKIKMIKHPERFGGVEGIEKMAKNTQISVSINEQIRMARTDLTTPSRAEIAQMLLGVCSGVVEPLAPKTRGGHPFGVLSKIAIQPGPRSIQ